MLSNINKLAYSHSTWEIFYDFLELSAICISNSVDLKHYDEREKQYLHTIKKYTPKQQILLSEMFGLLVLSLEHEYQRGSFIDILGCLFHELELHNKYKGQFFTPQHICTLMGKLLLDENDKTIEDEGFIKVAEPACGSGAMILGFAQAMKDCGYNHSQQMFVLATDIDLKCVYMCYLQLSLYGIPAIVIHGNSLTLEEWSRWYTPVYIVDGWGWRNNRQSKQKEVSTTIPTEIILPSSQDANDSFKQLDIFTDK